MTNTLQNSVELDRCNSSSKYSNSWETAPLIVQCTLLNIRTGFFCCFRTRLTSAFLDLQRSWWTRRQSPEKTSCKSSLLNSVSSLCAVRPSACRTAYKHRLTIGLDTLQAGLRIRIQSDPFVFFGYPDPKKYHWARTYLRSTSNLVLWQYWTFSVTYLTMFQLSVVFPVCASMLCD